MSTVAAGILETPSPAALPREGGERRRVAGVRVAGAAVLPDGGRGLEARTGGTPVRRASGAVCRTLEDTGTIATVTRCTDPGT